MERREHGVRARLARVERGELVVEAHDSLGLLRERSEIDFVVGSAAPGVEHGDVVASRFVQEPARERKALRVLADDGANGGVHDEPPRRSSITSPAVALPELTTPGTPAPGCVP